MPFTHITGSGVWLVDKPIGWTSHDVVAKIRRQTGVKKVGHAGTLDPLATGLLIVLVGKEFTKQQDEFLKLDKVYEVTGQLGTSTDTYDSTGQEISRADWDVVNNINREQVLQSLDLFKGSIEQTVPAYSAVKIKGQKLYKAARNHTLPTVLPSRIVTIYSLELIDFAKDSENRILTFSLNVHCSSGTYIRSLVHDIGQQLGVGARVTALRRLAIGKYGLV